MQKAVNRHQTQGDGGQESKDRRQDPLAI